MKHRCLLAALALVLLAAQRVSGNPIALVGCSLTELSYCMYPNTYIGVMFNVRPNASVMYTEACSNDKHCFDSFVSLCLDKEGQEYYFEKNAAHEQQIKALCDDGPLRADIMEHWNCWKGERYERAVLECNRFQHFMTQLIGDDAVDGSLEAVVKGALANCDLARVALGCTWPLVSRCDVTSRDCLPGYLWHAVRNRF